MRPRCAQPRSRNTRTTGIEWIGGTVVTPAYVTGEGEPFRLEALFWMGADGAILGAIVAKPGDLAPLASESLQSTIVQPTYGRPHTLSTANFSNKLLAS